MDKEATLEAVVPVTTDSDLDLTLDPCHSTTTSGTNRRRCWEEAFASESESVTPEPNEQMENVEEIDMCSSTTTSKAVDSKEETNIICDSHPGCLKTFTSIRDYEKHYNLRHRHKCITCKKSLPSAHILELHVLETHDALFSLMAEKKPMLACFLESCTSTFWKVEERKEHCLSEHKFPKSFKLWNLSTTSSSSRNKDKHVGSKHCGKGKANNQQKKENQNGEKMEVDHSSSLPSNEVSSSSNPSAPPNLAERKSDPKAREKLPSKQGDQTCSTQNKNQKKKAPVQITFGHSASRTFKPKYSFGLAKSPVTEEGVSSSRMELDLSDMKEVLTASTTI